MISWKDNKTFYHTDKFCRRKTFSRKIFQTFIEKKFLVGLVIIIMIIIIIINISITTIFINMIIIIIIIVITIIIIIIIIIISRTLISTNGYVIFFEVWCKQDSSHLNNFSEDSAGMYQAFCNSVIFVSIPMVFNLFFNSLAGVPRAPTTNGTIISHFLYFPDQIQVFFNLPNLLIICSCVIGYSKVSYLAFGSFVVFFYQWKSCQVLLDCLYSKIPNHSQWRLLVDVHTILI